MTDTYRTLVVDPPWPQKGAGPLGVGTAEGFVGTGASQPMPYSTMSLAAIRKLPVAQLVEADAHLYLWTTNGFLPDAFDIVKAWGFRYSTTLVWAKNPMGGGLGGHFGIATEYVLFCRRGSLAATGPRVGTTWFNWKRPYDAKGKPMHSGKPDAFYELAAAVSPGPMLELFARKSRLGWDTWGNQAPNAVSLACLDGAA